MRRPPTQLAEPAAKEPSGRFGKRPGDADHRYVNGARPIADRASCPLGVPTTRPGFVQKAPTAYPRRSNDSEHGIRKEIADAKSADESRARGKMWGFGILRNLFLRECADYS